MTEKSDDVKSEEGSMETEQKSDFWVGGHMPKKSNFCSMIPLGSYAI
jgi:hypothetical protein